MPDELDQTTERLVAELAARITPSLTKSLSVSIPTIEFMNALERHNKAGNDLRTSIRTSIDDNRVGRSVMMQSIGTLSDEISALKKAITTMPENIGRKIENENHNDGEKTEKNYDEKLNEITELLNELIKGIQQFSETYAKASVNHESVNVNVNPDMQESIHNNGMLEKLLNETLPSLEGLLRAQSKSQTQELHELSREINAMNEQNNIALLHEVHEAIDQKNAANDSDSENTKMKKLLMINMCLSGACVFMSVIMFLMLIFR